MKQSPTVAELKSALDKMGVVRKSSDSKTVLKTRLTKAKNAKLAKKSPKKSPKKRSKMSPRKSPKKSARKDCRPGYSRNKASKQRCAPDGSNKLKSIKEIKEAVKEAYYNKYGEYPKLVGKSKSQAINMLARINKCPESGKVWDSVAEECRDRKVRSPKNRALTKLEKLSLAAQKDIIKRSNEIIKLKEKMKFTEERAALSRMKADINKREKEALEELDAKAGEAEEILMEEIMKDIVKVEAKRD